MEAKELSLKNHSWLKFIDEAQNAFQLREIFNKTYGLISNEKVSNQFFNRIQYLTDRAPIGSNVRYLEDLKEDIEDEIETKRKKDKRSKEVELKVALEEVLKKTNEEIVKHVFIDGELITDVDFRNSKDLIFRAEKELIYKSLMAFDQNRTQAAKALGISIRTLRNKLSEYTRERALTPIAISLDEETRQEVGH